MHFILLLVPIRSGHLKLELLFNYLPACLPHSSLQIPLTGLSVDTGRIQTLVTEKCGNLIQRYTGIDQILGKGMAQVMGGDTFQLGLISVLFHHGIVNLN